MPSILDLALHADMADAHSSAQYDCVSWCNFPNRRSTVIQRDLLLERLVKGWSFTYPPEELAELARMVSDLDQVLFLVAPKFTCSA